MKKWANLAVLLLLISAPALCQEKDLTINAQTLNYSEDGKFMEASGSVEAAYKNIRISADQLFYYTSEKQIHTGTGFNLKYQGLEFKGQELNFNIRDRSGEAYKVQLLYKNAIISGQIVKIDPDKVHLINANFTTCDLPSSHYHFYAKEIVFYPKDGWLICYFSVFWVDNVPTMPVPIYIYDLKAEEKGLTNAIPYPQFGSNDWDGSFVVQSFPWHASRALNGNVSTSYSEKKGFGYGVDSKFAASDQNDLFVKVYSKAYDPILSILEYKHNFGAEIRKDGSFAFQLLKSPSHRQYEFSSRLSLNEIVNYEKVSMLPLLSLSLEKSSYGNFDFHGSLSGGFITEESSGASLLRSNVKLSASTSVWNGWAGKLKPEIDNDVTFYSNGTRWVKTVGGIQLNRVWSPYLSGAVGYRHFFINSGASPYKFEIYRFIAVDQFNAGVLFGRDASKFGINAIYNLPNFNPQEIDYIARIGIHCFNIELIYKAMRREFNFSFGIN